MQLQDPLSTWHSAERLVQARRTAEAAALYRQLAQHPEFAPQAHLRLSLMASADRRLRDATAHALAAFEHRHPDPDLLEMIAKRLNVLGEVEAMRECAMDPAIRDGAPALALAEIGKLLHGAYLPTEALELLEHAHARGFDHPRLDYLIGTCLTYLGEDTRAVEALERSLRQEPHDPATLRALTRLQRDKAGAPTRVDRLREAIARVPADAPNAPMLHYALFAELDRLDDTDAAWNALETGMRLRRAQLAYDAAADQALFDALQAMPIDHARAAAAHDDGPRPVFIVGMPRSGSTLLESMLGNHPEIADAGELRDVVRQLRWCRDLPGPAVLDVPLVRAAASIDPAEFGRRYLEKTRWRARDHVVYTDKLPLNYQNIAWILHALPQARILHMTRDPMDTCFSNLKEWFAGAYPHSYDQHEMADHYRRYRGLMTHWRAHFADRILDVNYQDLVTDPERTMRRIVDFLGLPWVEGMSAVERRAGAVATPSAVQVREGVHTRFLGQWKRYEDKLGPLKDRLGAYAYFARR